MVTDSIPKKAEVVRSGTYASSGGERHGTDPSQSHRTRTGYLDKAAHDYRQGMRGDQTARPNGDDPTKQKG